MPFKPGQSGDPTGGYRQKLWRAAIQRAVGKPVEGQVDLQRIDKIAEALIMAAEQGDTVAMKEIGDRLDGKPAQAIIGGEDEDPPVRITVESDADVIKRYLEKP